MPQIPIQPLHYTDTRARDALQPSVDLFSKWKLEMEPKLKLEKLERDLALAKLLEESRRHQETLAETTRYHDIMGRRPVGVGGGTAWTQEGGFQQVAPFTVHADDTTILPPAMGGGGGLPPALNQPGAEPAPAALPGLQPAGEPPALRTFTAPPRQRSPLEEAKLQSEIAKNQAQASKARQAPVSGQVTAKTQWETEAARRQKATEAVQKAYDKYLEDWNALQDQIMAIESNALMGKTNWAEVPTAQKTAWRDQLKRRQQQLTQQYQQLARAAGWNEQGRWAAGGSAPQAQRADPLGIR